MGMSLFMKDLRNKIGNDLLQMPSVTVIKFDDSGRVLLLKHRDTKLWVAPGGAIEPGETPADAAVREMWEETGLFVELTRIIGVYGGPEYVVEYSNGDKTSYVMIVFESRRVSGTLNPANDEIMDGGYFSSEEFVTLETQPWVQVVMPEVFDRKIQPGFKMASWKPECLSQKA
jgi:8-oxo-dGTP pyrophosphatase MutT (NUDIX family)